MPDADPAPVPSDFGPVAIVDDDPTVRRMMRLWLEAAGYETRELATGREAMEAVAAPLGAMLLDLGLDDMPGMHVLRHVHAADPELPVIVVTAQRGVESAVEAMRTGAYDYLAKPIERERLLAALTRAVERRQLSASVQKLQHELDERHVLGSIIGASVPMRELARQVERVLASDVSVCVFGESGTGKELVARAIHSSGRRRRGPFVAINCAAVPEALQESELFGHERGSFTGANSVYQGRIEQANNGTLFLDELGEMSASTQAALLRTLQERTVRRVGGRSEIPVNVRIVAATHRDLEAAVRAGRFREDLYFRLVVYPIHLPPLRDRRDDIPQLVGHFLRKFESDVGRAVTRVSPDALEALARHHWPGNVRELENVVHRAMLASDGHEITLASLPPDMRALGISSPVPRGVGPSASDPSSPSFTGTSAPEPTLPDGCVVPLRELEKRAISHALRASGGSVGKAAKLLGMGRATLYRRLADLDAQGRPGQA